MPIYVPALFDRDGPRCGWRNHKSHRDVTDKSRKKTTSGRSEFTEKENFGWLSFQICRKNHNKESLEGKFQNENKAGTDTANQ